MKKFLKTMLTLSLLGSVLSTNVAVFAEEETEDVATEEVTTEEGEAVEVDTELTAEERGTLIEDPTEIYAFLNEANSEAISQTNSGYFSIGFGAQGTSAVLAAVDYIISYNIEPNFSAEVDLIFDSALTENGQQQIFAYYHNGKILEYRDETWYSEDAAELEAILVETIQGQNGEESDVDLREKYMDVYETDTHYVLSLKEDVNTDELWNDLNTVYDIDGIKESLKAAVNAQAEVDASQLDLLDTLLSPETLAATLENDPRYEVTYDKESGYLVNNFFSLNVDVSAVYEILGVAAEEAPETMNILFESVHTNHGNEFDFSFLDEVAPAE